MNASLSIHPGQAAAGLVENGEFHMARGDFEMIAAIMLAETGITLAGNKANLVYSRLAKRLRLLGLRSFGQYCELVDSPAGQEERQAMIAALTTNVTRFFREPHHFEHLRTQILPPLLADPRNQKIRLWSAACSTGQEPYSMALTLLSLVPDAAKYDIRILATDIDPNVLAAGAEGIYDAVLAEAVPPAMRQRWFTELRDGTGRLRIIDEVRALVSFRKLNLIGSSWPMRGLFQAIFCRNVVIYFDGETQAKIWSHMLPLLDPAGALYIGHSERITGPAEAVLRNDGITIYRKHSLKGAAA